MPFLSNAEIEKIGFKSFGSHLQLSSDARFYNPGNISLGSHVRIDDFTIISAGAGGISIGSYVHIACHCGLMGAAEIVMEDFTGLSSRVFIYSSSDNYSGIAMTNPTVPPEYTDVISEKVFLGKHVIVGTCSSIMPGVSIGEGSAIGGHSFVNHNIRDGVIATGNPCRKIKRRKNLIFDLEKSFLSSNKVD